MNYNSIKTELSDDLISRQAVEEIINDIRDCISVEGHCAILERLKKLPSVNPQEPKTGHWINTKRENLWKWPVYECSECHEWISDLHIENYKYCFGCGARMVEPQETQESDHKCHTCKHYTSGERDGSCGSYICKNYSDWESEDKE